MYGVSYLGGIGRLTDVGTLVGNKTRAQHNRGRADVLWSPKRGIAATDELIEVAIEIAGSALKQQVGTARCPADVCRSTCRRSGWSYRRFLVMA